MDRFDRVATVAVTGIVIAMTAIAIPNLHTARQRALQRHSMATIAEAARQHEAGKPFPPLRDAWGHPMQVRVNGRHYSIRAAGSDGRFERSGALVPFRMTSTYEADIVFIDGHWRQMPEGI